MKIICLFLARKTYNVNRKIKFENWCNSTFIFISFTIGSISTGPPFRKSCVTLLHMNVFTGQTQTYPTIRPIKPSEYWNVDRKKDKNDCIWITSVKTDNCFYNALAAIVYAGAFSGERQFEIMKYDTWASWSQDYPYKITFDYILWRKVWNYVVKSGGVGGRVVNTSNSGSEGLVLKPRPSRCFLRQGTLLHLDSLHPGV